MIILCYISTDKFFHENKWVRLEIEKSCEIIAGQLCEKDVMSIIDLKEMFDFHLTKISLIDYFSGHRNSGDIEFLAKIIKMLLTKSCHYALFNMV